MSSPSANAQYTWDDFIALEDDDRRELIDGELVEVEVPSWRHERIVATLCFFLVQWSRAGHGGQVVASGYKVRIGERRGVMPDVQFYADGNDAPHEQDNGLVRGCPDLVVEIISPGSQRYDRVKKLRYYAERGVPEYWIVDPKGKTIERLVVRDASYVIADGGSEGESFQPASFAGLTIPLAELWA